MTDISREVCEAWDDELRHYAEDTPAEIVTADDARDIAKVLMALRYRVDELEKERSTCEKCLHVRLFENLNTPCPHCIIESMKLEKDWNDYVG